MKLMHSKVKKALTKVAVTAALSVSGLFGVNAAIIFLAQPGNLQVGEQNEIVSQYGTVSIAFIDDLKPGGLAKLSAGTTGYVNVLSPEPVIYLNGKEFEKAPPQHSYIYKHELAHILQKRLIAKEAGGYPTVENPFVSFAYYYKLIQLNHDFARATPVANHDAILHSPFTGLEGSSDCFAQQSDQENPMPYLGSSLCNPEQRYIALSMLTGRWPTPLSENEKQLAAVSPYPESHEKPKHSPLSNKNQAKNIQSILLPKSSE